MSSYPALAIRQPEGILDQYGKAMQLKALAGQTAMQPGQLELQQQQIESQKRMLQDKQAETAAMKEWSQNPGKISMDELPNLILKNGGSADAALSMKQKLLAQQTQIQTLDKDKIANYQAHAGAIGSAAQAVLGVAPELRPQAYQQKMKELLQQGVISPQDAQQPYDEDIVKLHAAAAMSTKDQIDTELKKRETAATELKAQTEAKKLQAEMPGGPLAPVDKAEMNDWLDKNPDKGPSDFMAYKAKLVPQFNFNLQGGGPTPKTDDPLVQAVANSKMKIQDVLTPRTPLPMRRQFLAAVLQVNPDYKSSEYDIEKGVMKSATSGKIADNLTAFNTAIEHAKQLHTAAEALNVGDMRTMNKIGNALGYEFGSDKTTNFNVIKNALSGEISKVFKGGQATDAEIKAVQEPFDAANSPAQLKGAIRNAIALMNSKRDALKKQVEMGSKGKANFGEEKPAATGAATHRYNPQTGQIEEIKP